MDNQYWIDGFNFFHHWEKTRDHFRRLSGVDMAKAIDRSLRTVCRELGAKSAVSVVFLDGGLARLDARQAGIRVRYCGPGKKADDRMADDLALLGPDAGKITAVSNDRELKARLRLHGASCLSVNEFLALFQAKPAFGKNARKRKNAPPATDDPDILRQKCRTLSPSEIAAWLDFFGGEEEEGEIS